MEKMAIEKRPMALLAAVLLAWLVTGISVLLLSVLMLRLQLDEGKLSVGITVIYATATFFGGSIAGRGTKEKKYLWGMLCGLFYFCILFAVSMIRKRTGAYTDHDGLSLHRRRSAWRDVCSPSPVKCRRLRINWV